MSKQEVKDLHTYLNRALENRGLCQLGELYSVRDQEAQKTLKAVN